MPLLSLGRDFSDFRAGSRPLALSFITLLTALAFAAPAESQVLASLPAQEREGGLARELGRREFEGLLQAFVDVAYQKGFRHLGDERDFDHAHILFSTGPDASRPVAILYHTQELASLYHEHKPGGEFDYVDPEARNWIQWVDGGRVENARKYLRSAYPDTLSWRVFQESHLPGFQAYHTITDKMLDPRLLGAQVARSRQWVFRRAACPGPEDSPEEEPISVLLPTRERVCMRLRL